MEESASKEIHQATVSINNEDHNTQKEAAIPGGNERKNDELVIEIEKIVERREIQSSTQCRIYKVPYHLRKWNEEAYTPQVVSIGPFHHKNERLKAMEELKERYFSSFVKQNKLNLGNLVGKIREMEERIRGCYDGNIDLSSDRFVKMILVDASFILGLLFRRKRGSSSLTSHDEYPMVVEPTAAAITLDLILLENQLPFFVIEELYNLASPSLSNDHGLLVLSLDYFRGQFNIQGIALRPNVKIQHFTDLLRTFQLPPPEELPRRSNQLIFRICSATQLHEAGVKFKVGTSKSCLAIKFERGVLEIPVMVLENWTEVVARNIIALEQICYIEDGYFTDYFIFMDLFIRTRKDVDLLRDKNILVSFLGDSYAAEFMIKNILNRGILWISSVNDDYANLCRNLNNFCDNPWQRRKALVKRDFFSTPSAAASTVFNVLVITMLTLIQTVCSIMQVRGSS